MSFWEKLKLWQSGKKTFLVCGVTLVYAVVGWYLKKLGAEEAVNLVLAALGGASLRAGMQK